MRLKTRFWPYVLATVLFAVLGIWMSRPVEEQGVRTVTASVFDPNEFDKLMQWAELYDQKEFIVTAYCPCVGCCGDVSPGVTASGLDLTDFYGMIVAAPPEYPFGTIMDVPGYGIATVQDRGGVIKGNRLDVFFQDHEDARQFGAQWLIVKVRIIE